ncbi:MAG: UDP-N-acetylmuramoyl-tripeptide--D-alanyl-D-alanine ligase [Christensenellales bacterium]
MKTIIDCIIAVALSPCVVAVCHRLLTLIQLDGYVFRKTQKTDDIVARLLFCGVASCIITYITYLTAILSVLQNLEYIVPICIAMLAIYHAVDSSRCGARQTLKLTARASRLVGCFTLLTTIIFVTAVLLGGMIRLEGLNMTYVLCPFVFFVTPTILKFCLILLTPLENAIKKRYIVRATRTLDSNKELLTIAVTGSYGKTSVKRFLTTILSQKFRTFCTPYNYNTPMGVCLSVKQMPIDTQIFVVEMGARYKGDIAELCNMTKPDVGVLTGIENQHLESFGTIDNIIDTKCELVEYLGDKPCFFGECRYLDRCVVRSKNPIVVGSDGNVQAKNVVCDSEGSSFDLCIYDEKIRVKTKLIGKHNIQNILLAVAVAHHLGMSIGQIAKGIDEIIAVEHRLQVSRLYGGVTVIDDSYNSNKKGAMYAIDTLEFFEDKKKIVMSQGLVELGDESQDANIELGGYMAQKVDVAILIGVNAKYLMQGLVEKGMKLRNIYVVKDLEQAQNVLKRIVDKNSVVLIQNDLTDNY